MRQYRSEISNYKIGFGVFFCCALPASVALAEGRVIPPFLRGLGRRIYAAIFSFCAGVIPPLPMLGLSWL